MPHDQWPPEGGPPPALQQNDCKCCSEPPSATYGSSITHSGRRGPAGQRSLSQRVRLSDLLTWPAHSPDPNPLENLQKVLGNKVMAKKPTPQSPWRRVEEDWTTIPAEQ